MANLGNSLLHDTEAIIQNIHIWKFYCNVMTRDLFAQTLSICWLQKERDPLSILAYTEMSCD